MNVRKAIENSHGPEVPSLSALGLSHDEFEALSRQGFISEDRRGARTYYKLRFRIGRKQRVKYVGCDPSAAEAIRSELAELQAARMTLRELSHRAAVARQLLRKTGDDARSQLEEAGFHFHGFVPRKIRKTAR